MNKSSIILHDEEILFGFSIIDNENTEIVIVFMNEIYPEKLVIDYIKR